MLSSWLGQEVLNQTPPMTQPRALVLDCWEPLWGESKWWGCRGDEEIDLFRGLRGRFVWRGEGGKEQADVNGQVINQFREMSGAWVMTTGLVLIQGTGGAKGCVLMLVPSGPELFLKSMSGFMVKLASMVMSMAYVNMEVIGTVLW